MAESFIPATLFSDPLFQFLPQFLFAGQVELVFAGVNVGVLGQGDFDQCLILLLAEHNADGVVFRLGPDVAVKVVDVHLHLAEVLMRELANLEVDEHVGSQQPVIEDKIDEEVLFVEGEPLLPGLKEKALAQFEQELFDVGDDGRLQIGLGVAGLFLNAEKLQHVGVFEQVLRLGDMLALAAPGHGSPACRG